MLRSALMVAGDKEKHLKKLDVLSCDIALINLEDGVHDKKGARELIYNTFKEKLLKFSNLKSVVRVNPLDECGAEDIEVINRVKPDAIRVSKVKSSDDVKRALDLIDKDIELHLSIETKEAINSIKDLKIDSRVTTLYIGILDLSESLGLPQSIISKDNPTINYILSKFLVDSKSYGFTPIFLTYQDYKDTKGFEKWCHKAKAMGYEGTSCISPTQVEIANRVFALEAKEIEKAKYIKAIFEEQKSKGVTGFVDEKFGFIDEPIYKDACLVLSKLS